MAEEPHEDVAEGLRLCRKHFRLRQASQQAEVRVLDVDEAEEEPLCLPHLGKGLLISSLSQFRRLLYRCLLDVVPIDECIDQLFK